MRKTFSEELRDISELYTVGITQNKKTQQHVLTDCFEMNFEEKTSFYLASQKIDLLALSISFEYWFP